MVRPSLTADKPAVPVATLGGAVGAILATSILFLLPAAGFPDPRLASLVGGLVSGREGTAVWIGFSILFVVAWLALPIVLTWIWRSLPGHPVRFRGAVLRGVLFGLLVWAVGGLLLPLLGVLTRVPVEAPGFFALGTGGLGALAFLAACLAYGLVTAIVANLGGGFRPLDALGWEGHGAGHAA